MRERASSQRGKRLVFSNAMESNRRLALRRIGALTGLAVLSGPSVLLGGCGGGGGDSAMPAVPPVTILPDPSLGAHSLVYYEDGGFDVPISTAPVNTQTTGSTILACIGRGIITQHVPPTDNKGNTYASLEGPHNYPMWATSGTQLYADASAMGGTGHVVSTTNPNFDEITLAVVEIQNGGLIQDMKWNYPLSGSPLTSLSVTTTGPATLVAFWWGDSVVAQHTAVPDNGFTVIDSILDNLAIVQCAVAVKSVSLAGQYNVTWTATPLQGAQLYLVAVQKA